MIDSVDRKLIYVLSSSHSGSTLLAALLGSQKELFPVGETVIFSNGEYSGKNSDILCSCGNKIPECPFWSHINAILLSRLNTPIEKLDLRSFDEENLQKNTAFWDSLFKSCSEQIVVDSSKDITHFQAVRKQPISILPIYLTRSPYGVIYSEIKKGKNWIMEAFGYLHHHLRIRILLKDVDHLKIQYEVLATDPQTVIREILKELNLDYQEISLSWTEQDLHVLRSNSMIHQKVKKIALDDSWKPGLTTFQKVIIFMVTLILRTNSYSVYRFYLGIRSSLRFIIPKAS